MIIRNFLIEVKFWDGSLVIKTVGADLCNAQNGRIREAVPTSKLLFFHEIKGYKDVYEFSFKEKNTIYWIVFDNRVEWCNTNVVLSHFEESYALERFGF